MKITMKSIPILMVMLLSLAVEVLARDSELVGRWETRTEEEAGILSSIMSLGPDGAYKLELFAQDETGGALPHTIEVLDGRVFTGEWNTTDSLLVIHIELTPDVAMFFALVVAGLQMDLTGEEVSPEELQELAAQVEADLRSFIEETGSSLVPFMEITYELSGDTLVFHDEDGPTIWHRLSRTAVQRASWGQIKADW